MYDTRLEMAAGWLWDYRNHRRPEGTPYPMAYTYQPADVKEPFEGELERVIQAVDTYDEVRDVIRVDLRQIKDHTVRLYMGLYPDWQQSMTEEKLKELEGAIIIMLHHAKVTGDVPYDLTDTNDTLEKE